jgi:hypothetical protein
VLIWAFGLPFLPGYARRHRNGESELPRERPSLNVAVYEEGTLACYLLQEFSPDDVVWDGSSWRFGDTAIEEYVDGSQRTLRVALDCPIPAADDRLRGEVRIDGPARRPGEGERLAGHHDWTPLVGPALGRWDIRTGDVEYAGEGRGYHDCNGGRASLEDAGIHEWTWGRLPFEHEEIIYYIAWREPGVAPEALGVRIDADGHATRVPLTVDVGRWERARALMRYPEELSLRSGDSDWLHVKVAQILDDGPFYLRYFVEGSRPGESSVGFGEICRPDRIDLDLHRPLVRMRVHRVDGPNSIWLPLFSGPREGRIRRLMSQLGGLR